MKQESKSGHFPIRKVFKMAVIMILVLVGIFIAATLFISQNIKRIADYFIENEFENSAAGKVYDLSYDKINLRLLSGSLMVKGVSLTPKNSFFTSVDTLRLQNPVVFKVHIPEIKVNGLDRNFSLSLDKVDLSIFSLSKPEITVIEHLSKKQKEQAKLIKSKAVAMDKKAGLKTISIDHLSIIKGKFTWFDHQKNSPLANIGSINFDTKKMTLDLSGDIITELIQVFSNSNIEINDSHYPLENGLYELRFGMIYHYLGSDEIKIDSLRMIPKFDKIVFSSKIDKQTERLDLSIKSITLSKPNLELLASGEAIEMEALKIGGIILNAYRDKNVPMDFDRFPKLPQQALAGLQMAVNIPTVTISDASIVYEELLQDHTAAGKAPLRINSAVISNVTNQDSMIDKMGPMAWKIEGQLFDAASLMLNLKFTTNLANPEFSFSGTIGSCNMDIFNVMTENTANLRISSGKLQKIDFEIHASEDYATGTLTMAYEQLSVSPLRKNKGKKNEEMQLLGDIANIVLRNSNPSSKRDSEAKPAEVFFERDKNKGIFNFMAKSLLSGVKNTVLPVATETKEKYDRKQERESKQNERTQRRDHRTDKRNQTKQK